MSLCNLENIGYNFTTVRKYRTPGESINIYRIINKLNNNQIDYDLGTSTLNMLIFRFAPGILIGEDLRQIARDNVNNRVNYLEAFTPPSGMGDSILSFVSCSFKMVYSTLFFILFSINKKHSYFLLISLPL